MLFPGAPARPDSLTDFVFELVRDAIINKSLAPGSVMTASDLATRLNVSKTPVRESMIRLKEAGLLVPDGRQLRVITPSRQLIHEAYEFRLYMEPHCARLAAQRAGATVRDQVAASAQRAVAGADSSDEYYAAGRDFHLRIAQATDNALLRKAVEQAHVFTLTLSRRDLPAPPDQAGRADDHVAVAKAIRAGEGDLAADLMRRHITVLMESALARFGEE
ncbi:putative GntR family transcriptional regulator [Actinacidiphila reveromycinica]|uniref:Putative GntR family transcriptional regulator n=1 Tax=Actinacidiphila reveromycinica TaxID=659352 RepID=A0A7U3VRM9_9ACTN|nr:putative GntR family transcriptional regulator [Streptomyces sp. SN-593]